MSIKTTTHSVSDAKVVTPSNSTDLPGGTTKLVLVGVAGNLQVTMENMVAGTSVVLPVPAGYSPIRVKRIWAASTTATGIVALY